MVIHPGNYFPSLTKSCFLVLVSFSESEAGKIQVYVRVRPFTEREKEKREANAIEIHQEHSLVSCDLDSNEKLSTATWQWFLPRTTYIRSKRFHKPRLAFLTKCFV